MARKAIKGDWLIGAITFCFSGRKRKAFRLASGVLLSLFLIPSLYAQPYGNEWIKANQSYFKITIAAEGMYRLTHQQLLDAGVPLGTLDARRLQLFHRGVEQAVYLPGQEDGRLDPADFVEFYGKPADGATDTELYLTPEAQPHTYHNLFSDSSTYFLTWHLSNERGKRIASPVPENNVDNLPAETYHFREVLRLQTNNYSQGKTYREGEIILSQYDFGEGWTGTDIAKGNNQLITVTELTGRVEAGPNPGLEVQVVGRNNLNHKVEVYVGPSSGSLRLWQTVEFSAHDPAKAIGEINWNDISAASELLVRVNVVGFPDAADRAAVSYVRLTYAQATSMEEKAQKVFRLKENEAGKSFIRFIDAPSQVALYDVTTPESARRIGIVEGASEFTAVVDQTAAGAQLLATSAPLIPASVKQVTMPSVDPAVVDYVIISHSQLRKTTTSGMTDPVLSYKTYRESAAGGTHRVLLLDIDEVFDMFNYGEVSPLAIRRLGAYLLANGDPQHMFLIGKGTTVNFNYYRQMASSLIHFIPTFGTPGSDIALLAGLNGTTYDSPIAIGRLNARHADDVEAYYNKVVEMEGTPFDDLWRKNLIHLSGGATHAELNTFRRYVDGFKEIASGKYLGGHVITTSKSTSNTIEFINVSEEVNNGVALITFFGHSGSFSTDIDIGMVSNPGFGYNNKGKYPVILVNGCDAGNIFATSFTFGEDWTLTPDLGALGLIAHSYKGFSNNLRDYSTNFYNVAFGDSVFIRKSLGAVINEAGNKFLEGKTSVAEEHISQVQQMVLQGDPAVKIFGASKPDYYVGNESVELIDIDGNSLRVAKDTFALRVVVKNFGTATGQPLEIRMRRRLADGTLTEHSLTKSHILREDTLYFGISNPELAGLGNNIFEVLVDAAGKIDELNETNNTATLTVWLSKGTTIHLFPLQFGIARREVGLVVQASDLLSPERTLEIEIDSLPGFNSGFRKRFTEQLKTVLIKKVDLEEGGAIPDSTAIFWRSRYLEPLAGEDTSWVQSSFTVVKDSASGFAMVSANQFADAELTGIMLTAPTFEWSFLTNDTPVDIKTHGGSNTDLTKEDIDVVVGGAELFVESTNFNVCRVNTLNVLVLDRQSTAPYAPIPEWTVFNSTLTCGLNPKRIHNFTNDEMYNPTASGGGLRRLSQLIDATPEGDFVLFFNIGTVEYSRWDAEVKEKLKLIGVKISTLNSLEDGQPVIFFGKKGGAEGSAIEVLSNGSTTALQEQQIVLSDVVEGRYFSGGVTSGRIGPAKKWGGVSHRVKFGSSQTLDNYHINVYGLRKDGTKDPLIINENEPFIDLSGFDAGLYPHMQLSFSTDDEQTLQPVQLRELAVTFEPVPEGILFSHVPAIRNKQMISLNEGEELQLPFTFFNVSPTAYTDSLIIDQRVIVKQTNSQQNTITKLPPLAAGDSVQLRLDVATLDKAGLNDMRVSVESSEEELFLNNNRFYFSEFLEVKADVVNPVLDVTFDGSYILNGDIVAPDPLVSMRLTDDYPYIAKDDTIGMEIYLKRPCEECEFERVSFSGGKISWSIDTEKNELNIEYRPGPLENGMHALRVIATDASGNQAGSAPYEISFEVINESTITHFYPYPNPFSSSTRFVFTLTGSVLPDQLKIQIMTVSGRIVREITQNEIGPLKIGNNITEFAWDGTDEFGDQLANGVYLYRVLVRMNGEQVEQRATSADKAFKNGFGKMYLLR